MLRAFKRGEITVEADAASALVLRVLHGLVASYEAESLVVAAKYNPLATEVLIAQCSSCLVRLNQYVPQRTAASAVAAAVLTASPRPAWGDDEDDDPYAFARRLSMDPSGDEAGEADAAAAAADELLGVS